VKKYNFSGGDIIAFMSSVFILGYSMIMVIINDSKGKESFSLMLGCILSQITIFTIFTLIKQNEIKAKIGKPEVSNENWYIQRNGLRYQVGHYNRNGFFQVLESYERLENAVALVNHLSSSGQTELPLGLDNMQEQLDKTDDL
jgi:hypothetical protein